MQLHHQTKAQFAARFVDRFRGANRDELVRLARFIIAKIADGSFTENEVQQAFGISAARWTILKDRIIALKTNADVVDAANGSEYVDS